MNAIKALSAMHVTGWIRAACKLVTGFTVLIERRALSPLVAR